jgi:hypothetical protein
VQSPRPGARAPATRPPATSGGHRPLQQAAALGAPATIEPQRASGEGDGDAGAASTILPAAPQTPRPAAPQPGSGPRRPEEREEEEEEEEEEEDVRRLGPRIPQGCARSAPRSRPGWAGARCRGAPGSPLRVGATRSLAGRTLGTLRMNDDSAAHSQRARVTPVSADAGLR